MEVIVDVDVQVEITIRRPVGVVSVYAADSANAQTWYENIKSVEWKTEPPLAVGSKIAFTAQFLGRRLAYTYELTDYVPGERLTMRTAEGPFSMETTYRWSEIDEQSSHMTLRNHGQPTGFARVTAPLMAAAMRHANRKDLKRLKSLLEDDEIGRQT
jgi:uncharacterized membrane protein